MAGLTARLWTRLAAWWRGPRAAAVVDEPDRELGDDTDEPDDLPVVLRPTEPLDLHTFAPRDVPGVVADYLAAAVEAELTEVRIIHGKGKGVQRERVHAILRRHPAVAGFALAPADRGGWGATVVTLRRPGP